MLARTPDLCGFNVTIPYKREVMPLLDALSHDARMIGAVNCVRRAADGSLTGHNTDVVGLRASLDELLGGEQPEHALVLDVSDMRVAFRITGPRAGQVLAKLSPAEIGAMPPDGLRRSRAAQAACGIWREADGYVLIGFRSIADYLRGILTGAAIPGSGLDPR